MTASFFRGSLFIVLKLAVGAIFVYTGAVKLGNLQAFADSIATFDLAPQIFANLIALTLPILEVILGGMLILGKQDRIAALGISFLAMLFAVAFLQAAIRGLNVDCGCFGAGGESHSSAGLGLLRALIILLIAAWLYMTGARKSWPRIP